MAWHICLRSVAAISCWTMAGPAVAHDWYSGLTSPTGERCCTGHDCQAVDQRYNPATHRLEIGIEGAWVPVDSAKLVTMPSPDGSAHACYSREWLKRKMTPVVRCVILPGEV